MGINIRKAVHFLTQAANYASRQYLIKMDPVAYARSLGVTIGENVHFYGMRSGMFGSEPWLVTIGNNVYITSECQFVTHDGGPLILRGEVPDLELTSPVMIGNDVYIGMRTIILPGVKIGNRCIIGAGSIVNKSIPDNSVAAGVPARVLKTTDDYLQQAEKRSLHLGHLSPVEKEKELKKYFGIKWPDRQVEADGGAICSGNAAQRQ